MKKVQTCESLVLTGTDWVSLRYHHILEDTAEVMIEDFSGITNPVFAECMMGCPAGYLWQVGIMN